METIRHLRRELVGRLVERLSHHGLAPRHASLQCEFQTRRTCVASFLQLPLAELHNLIVSLDAIWGRRAAEIREQLSLTPTAPARFALLERLLLARLYEAPPGLDPGLEVIQYGVAELAQTHGALPIRASVTTWVSGRNT